MTTVIDCEIPNSDPAYSRFSDLEPETPDEARVQILKDWADEKESVLHLHERGRQEWELERAELQQQERDLQERLSSR